MSLSMFQEILSFMFGSTNKTTCHQTMVPVILALTFNTCIQIIKLQLKMWLLLHIFDGSYVHKYISHQATAHIVVAPSSY